MTRSHRSVVVATPIAHPREVVWAELAEIAHHVDWMRDATEIRFVGDQRRGVGTEFECDTKVGPIRLTDRMTITAWEDDRRMAVHHRGAVSGTGEFTLEDGPEATTVLHWREQLAFPWWLAGRVGATIARPVLAALWRTNLKAFRAQIDRSASG